jgi:hypothetical protein
MVLLQFICSKVSLPSPLFYGKALAFLLNVLGAERPGVAACYGNMAGVYYTKEGNVKALELYEKSLAIQLKVLGADHPDVASSYGNMASAYSYQGDKARRWSSARRLSR